MLKEALAALSFKVEINGEVHGLTLKPGDMVRYERQFGESILDAATKDDEGNVTGMRFDLDKLFFLTYAPAKRQGVIPADMEYEGYLDVVDDIQVEGDDETPKDEAAS